MRDQDVLRVVTDGLSGLDMDRPAEDIIAAGTSRRRRRLAAVTTAGVMLAGLALAVPALTGSGSTAPPSAQRPASMAPAQPVAFSVASRPDGMVTLKLSNKYFPDPDAVRKALSEAGVPAEIRVGASGGCYSNPAPSQLEQVFPSVSEADDESTVLLIDPSAIPQGAVVTFRYANSSGVVWATPRVKGDTAANGVSFGLAWKNKMTCK